MDGRGTPSMQADLSHQHGAREAILARIRRALQVPAPLSLSHGHGAPRGAVESGAEPALDGLPAPIVPGTVNRQGEAELAPLPGGTRVLQTLPVLTSKSPQWRRWLPPVNGSWEEQMRLLAENLEALRAELHLLDGPDALPAALAELGSACGWRSVAVHGAEWSGLVEQSLSLPVMRIEAGYDHQRLAACDVGITACDALVAQTGSVLLCTRSAGGRALSVLPPHHVVLARREQLVPDLAAAFALVRERYGAGWPSLLTFITGPSRTGDIERILVLGAHGPKRLTILCM